VFGDLLPASWTADSWKILIYPIRSVLVHRPRRETKKLEASSTKTSTPRSRRKRASQKPSYPPRNRPSDQPAFHTDRSVCYGSWLDDPSIVLCHRLVPLGCSPSSRPGPNTEARRRFMPRQPLLLNRGNNPFAKIHRVRLCHPCWPLSSSQHVELQLSKKRNPKSIRLKAIPL